MARLILFFYNVLLYALIPVVLVRYLVRGIRRPAYWKRLGERFGNVEKDIEPGKIWVHAVSVGEVNAAVPLVKQLLEEFGVRSVIVTCATPTGSDQIRRTLSETVDRFYAPLDVKFAVNRFINRTRPRAVIIMETEIWPNLVRTCQRSNVKVMFANMRISDRSYKNACRFRSLFRNVLQQVDGFCVQTEIDSERLVSIGANPDKVLVTGNLKFEMKLPDNLHEKSNIIRNQWGADRPVIVLGSSHQGEEEGFLKVFRELRGSFEKLVCVVVPRHPERFDSVFSLLSESEYTVARRTDFGQFNQQEIDIVLVDTMGELLLFYAASDAAVVGGSFVPVGGHNVLECLAVEVPVLFGPHMENFREISNIVVQSKAGRQLEKMEDLSEHLCEYLGNDNLRSETIERGREVISSNSGALGRTYDELFKLLYGKSGRTELKRFANVQRSI